MSDLLFSFCTSVVFQFLFLRLFVKIGFILMPMSNRVTFFHYWRAVLWTPIKPWHKNLLFSNVQEYQSDMKLLIWLYGCTTWVEKLLPVSEIWNQVQVQVQRNFFFTDLHVKKFQIVYFFLHLSLSYHRKIGGPNLCVQLWSNWKIAKWVATTSSLMFAFHSLPLSSSPGAAVVPESLTSEPLRAAAARWLMTSLWLRASWRWTRGGRGQARDW